MDKEQQRIAIAEACGWTEIEFYRPYGEGLGVDRWRGKSPLGMMRDLPDYLNDLNAMNEAERVMTKEQHRKFTANLWMLIPCQHLISTPPKDVADAVVSATSAQRAEAFLRTLNLWST